jgi:hypothetical protein
MSQQPGPVVVVQQVGRTNGLGIAGFIVSLLGLLGTCGLLSPVGLLLSFIAMFKAPRGFAIAGVVLGLIGSILAIIAVFFIGLATIGAAVGIGTALKPAKATMDMLVLARDVQDQLDNGNPMPPDLKSLPGVRSHQLQDPWGHPYHLVAKKNNEFQIASDGPDGKAGTSDDVTVDSTDVNHSQPNGATTPRPSNPD